MASSTTAAAPTASAKRTSSADAASTGAASDYSDLNGVVSPHSLPPAVLRLLSLSSPLITAIDDFLQLATWTGPNGGGTRSTLLLLTWTGVCLFAYPLLRYAPQLIVLAVILGSAVPNLLLSSTKRKRKPVLTIPTLTASTLTQTQAVELLQKLSSILDVCSTLHAHLVLPIWQALTWQHPGGPGVTIGTAIVSLTLGSLWTLCFADWPAAWGKLTTLVPLEAARQWLLASLLRTAATIEHIWHAHFKLHYEQAGSPQFRRMLEFMLRNARIVALWVGARIAVVLPTTVSLATLPPFPLFSLSLRHFFLALGLAAFSWCSTYATLVRHALWKSALIRRGTRGVVRLVSAGYLGGGGEANAGLFAATTAASAKTTKSESKTSAPDRINTVSYRFELYENQRWWMGLDWTAALLPQERASWTDVNLAPVSPPSSFNLPRETVTMRPAPTKEKPNAWEKRTVRWKWEEEEWRVVVNGSSSSAVAAGGEDGSGAPAAGSGGRRASSSGTGAGGAPASPSSSSTLFASFGKRTSVSSAATASPMRSPSAQVAGAGSAVDNDNDDADSAATAAGTADYDESLLLEEDTDAQGWRYGDNSWEKMTPKSGMGKYTRRRRWVRRARMEEIVEGGLDKGVVDDEESREEDEKAGAKEGDEKVDIAITPPLPPQLTSSPASPASPTPAGKRGDFKARLAAAGGGGGGSGAGEALGEGGAAKSSGH